MKKRDKDPKKQIHVHIDADAFFASVEQAIHRELRGLPVAVGQNGGIVTALSYPAKDLGVSRVAPVVSVRKDYPEVTIAASDFNAYGIFSKRMDNIIRSHFPNLVKNSVDEGSVDMTEKVGSFEEAEVLIKKLQTELEQKLGCTFSFGIARTPLLSKLASSMNKPNGIEVLTDENVKEKIHYLPADCLSGIGKQGYKHLQENNIYTIGDFAKADPDWLLHEFSIVMPALQKQVLGKVVEIPRQKEGIKSMSRERSFPATKSYQYLHSQLSSNIEHLASRMRKEDLFTNRIGLVLRGQDFSHSKSFVSLSYPTRDPQYLLSEANKILEEIFQDGIYYRQVSVTCSGLGKQPIQKDLFGEVKESDSKDEVLQMVDVLEDKFGKKCISLASSLEAQKNTQKAFSGRVEGDVYPYGMLPGEEIGKRLQVPFIGEVN